MQSVKHFILICLFCFGSHLKAQTVQWASKVINYSSQKEFESYSAREVLGEPNSMPSKGYSSTAWQASSDDRKEFIHVGFNKPMKIRQVIIAENFSPGAVVKVQLLDAQNQVYDVLKKPADTLNVFSRFFYVRFDETSYEVASVKIFIDCRVVPGENQIDAIGISNSIEEINSEIKLASDLKFFSDIEKLSENINSEFTEVNPVIAPDGKTLYVNRKDFPPNSSDDEIWFATSENKRDWSKLQHVGPPLNNANSNSVSSISPDGNTMLLSSQYFKDVNSYGEGFSIAYRTKEGWSLPENAEIKNYANTDRFRNYFQSNDGKKVFMNVRREDTKGESDLYVSFLQKDNSWSEPMNLGDQINSSGAECCAFLASDNSTLYFSSNGFNGYGSNDIYMSRRLDNSWQNWSDPLNIGPPVNTDDWDAYYTLPASGDYAYFVKGGDIYRVKINEDIKPKPVVMIYGKVFNQKTNEPLGDAKITYEYLKDGSEAGIARSTPLSGDYKIVLPSGANYGFLASASGYISESDNLDVSSLTEYKEIHRDLFLVPAIAGETIRMNNVFFDFGKSELKQESFPELKRISQFLIENSSITISLSGHTDNIGNDADNLQLSQDRINSVMNYLLQNGISQSRMTAKGFGETQPIADNSTDEGRTDNRRVEFIIVK